jgi:hypothetical protein
MKFMTRRYSFFLCKALGWTLTVLVASAAYGADRSDLEGTQIIGNRELPKVIYIVPWKRPLPTDLVGRPAQSLLDEALAPIDREVFRREVAFHAQMQATPSSREAQSAAAAKP